MRYSLAAIMLTEEWVLEGRFEDAQEKYPEFADVLASAKEQGLKPKYIIWFVKQLKQEEQPEADKLLSMLKDFDKLAERSLIKQKDINQYKSKEDLESTVETAKETLEAKEKKKEAKQDAETIAEQGKYIVIEPKSEEASCKYGRGTKWCISATDTQNYFEKYSSEGARFYFFINKETNDKDAFVFYDPEEDEAGGIITGPNEVFDANDTKENLDYLFRKYPEELLAQSIKPIIGDIAFNKRVERKSLFQDVIDETVQILSRPDATFEDAQVYLFNKIYDAGNMKVLNTVDFHAQLIKTLLSNEQIASTQAAQKLIPLLYQSVLLRGLSNVDEEMRQFLFSKADWFYSIDTEYSLLAYLDIISRRGVGHNFVGSVQKVLSILERHPELPNESRRIETSLQYLGDLFTRASKRRFIELYAADKDLAAKFYHFIANQQRSSEAVKEKVILSYLVGHVLEATAIDDLNLATVAALYLTKFLKILGYNNPDEIPKLLMKTFAEDPSLPAFSEEVLDFMGEKIANANGKLINLLPQDFRQKITSLNESAMHAYFTRFL